MRHSIIRTISVLLLLGFSFTEAAAVARGKKHNKPRRAKPAVEAAAAVPVAAPAPPNLSVEPPSTPIPQQSTFTPDMKRTKKVAIVPAPPPPPGSDVVPPALSPR